ncbi:MAG: TIGR03790 family protein [Bacteroidetes bacterium]|nr:TIGR03790 family protein [Bacteroidota bacterium]
MRMLVSVLAMLLLYASSLLCQMPVDYRDVGLIINDNDTNSVAIGEYFIQKRNIPSWNVIHVQAPAKETITPEQFEDMRFQIEEYLTVTTGLVDSLNYFVTTKGVPLRVLHNNDGGDATNASVDAELMLILGAYANQIHQNTLFSSPTSVRTHGYFRKNEHYSRKAIVPGSSPPAPYDLFLTTRLTGLTKEDVFTLIDRSGPFTLVNKDSALWVFDRDPRPIQLDPYDLNFVAASQILSGKGWNVLLNEDSVFVTDQRNVLGYGSWGSNDHYDHHYTSYARTRNHWLPGSVAETYVSTSARNFTPGGQAGQSRIADLIAEGCTGASGYVFEPYTVALTWVNYLADRYTSGYNLAESYYMSNPTISWMAVIVGDPKTSIITEIPTPPRPIADVPAEVCKGSSILLRADSTKPGNMFWFAGDSATVLNAGSELTPRHPLYVASGVSTWVQADSVGNRTFTFMNENFVGRGLFEASVDIIAAPEAMLDISADTLYLSEGATLQCSVSAPGAVSWDWNFGDGATGTDPTVQHSYTRTGSFVVRVTVSNGKCTTVLTHTVVVLQVNGTDDIPALAASVTLGRNFPNPVSMVTAIPFTLPVRMHVRLRVFDALGRLVATLADENFDSGPHTIVWQPAQQLNGVYHCVLEADGTRQSQRMSIVH